MIYVCDDLFELKESEQELLLSLFPTEEKMRIQNKKSGLLESLVAYAILFDKTKGTHISRDSFGKPYFTDSEHVHFSISHTSGAVAVAISSLPIGVDIEKEDRAVSDAVLERICTPEESSVYKEKSSQDKATLWTLKEAYGKYKGKGLSLPLTSVSFPSLSPLLCSDRQVHTECLSRNGFTISYVAEKEEEFTVLSLKEFLTYLTS